MIEKYYEEELQYLYKSGKEFAKSHPDRARFLNIDAVDDRDPYVERLFEGFAFLAARIREKIDDSFPEITEGLINLLWPRFLAEIPSLAIVEFKPRKGYLQETGILSKGTELLSESAGFESINCKFTTTQDVVLNPMSLVSFKNNVNTYGNGILSLDFEIEKNIDIKNLRLSPLRLYIHAEMPIALSIRELFIHHTIKCQIDIHDNKNTIPIDFPFTISPGGFTRKESLFPEDSRSMLGYSLLQEFFIFPEKFLFIDIGGLEILNKLDLSQSGFSLIFKFEGDFPKGNIFNPNTFKIHCCPIINLFKYDTEPIINSGNKADYLVVADHRYYSAIRPHSIISIEGTDRKNGRRYTYQPLHSFLSLGRNNVRTYSSHYKPGFDNRNELHLSFSGNLNNDGDFPDENLSIQAWCTNGTLPREELQEGSISKPGKEFPDFLFFKNITRPTLAFPPPVEQDHLWMFLSHLSSNYKSLSTVESLKSLLRLYNRSGSENGMHLLEAIKDVFIKPVDSIYNNAVIRGMEYSISFDESLVHDYGGLNLFGEVLLEFLSCFITINSFLELVFVMKPSGAVISWNSLKGKKWII